MTLQEINRQTLLDGVTIETPLACQIVQIKENSTKTGKPFLEIEISDGTASEKIKIWQDARAYEQCLKLKNGECVEIKGSFWRNQFGLNIEIQQLRPLEPNEITELFAGTSIRREKLARDLAEIQAAVDSLEDPRLKMLCQLFLTQFQEKFQRAAAARDYHHARRGGLLEHTAQMMRTGLALKTVYPLLNWDLILAGILFHDSGKLWENDYHPEGFTSPLTMIGELLGHISLGIELVNRLWRTLETEPEFNATGQPPKETVRSHLLHLIASHHGQKEFGAPVTPRTPEGWMLHYIDNIDARYEMLQSTYAEKAQIAPGIFDYRKPLEGRAVEPLAKWQKTKD